MTNTCPECGDACEGLTFTADSDGCTRGRDANGAIRHAHLTKIAAQRMSAIGSRSTSKEGKAEAQELADALISVLVDEGDPRAEALRLLLTQLARAASKNATASLKAIESALGLVGSRVGRVAPERGQVCQVCGRADPTVGLEISPESFSFLAGLVAKAVAEDGYIVCRRDGNGVLVEV